MNLLFGVPALAGPGSLNAGLRTDRMTQTDSWPNARSQSRGGPFSMNRGFVLVVLLVLVLDWVIVFEDEEEHEDESVHGPNACAKAKGGFP